MARSSSTYLERRLVEKRLMKILAWFFCYMFCFFLLEGRKYVGFHIIHTGLDDLIPFQINFIYVYLFWFPYMAGLMLWTIFRQEAETSDKTIGLLISGMMVFLVISWLFPNGLDFRRYLYYDTATMAGMLMEMLHYIDTPTNVFPSMHVYMTLGFQVGLEHTKGLHPIIRWGSRLMALLIVLSTVFLKQHSIIDVFGAIALTGILYWYFFCRNRVKARKIKR